MILSVSAGGCARAGLLSRTPQQERPPASLLLWTLQSPRLCSPGGSLALRPGPFPSPHTAISCHCRRLAVTPFCHIRLLYGFCPQSIHGAGTSLPMVWMGKRLFVHSFTQQTHFQGPSRLSGSIPGLGRSPAEGRGYQLQNSWAPLVAQLVKNPPVMQETWVRSLGWEDPLEKGKATHSSSLENSIDYSVHGVTKSWT